MLRLYSMEELNTLPDNMGVCLRAFHETEYSRLSVRATASIEKSICLSKYGGYLSYCMCVCVSPLDDFCDLGLPVSYTLLFVSQLPHLFLQLPVGAAHLLKHARQLSG